MDAAPQPFPAEGKREAADPPRRSAEARRQVRPSCQTPRRDWPPCPRRRPPNSTAGRMRPRRRVRKPRPPHVRRPRRQHSRRRHRNPPARRSRPTKCASATKCRSRRRSPPARSRWPRNRRRGKDNEMRGAAARDAAVKDSGKAVDVDASDRAHPQIARRRQARRCREGTHRAARRRSRRRQPPAAGTARVGGDGQAVSAGADGAPEPVLPPRPTPPRPEDCCGTGCVQLHLRDLRRGAARVGARGRANPRRREPKPSAPANASTS